MFEQASSSIASRPTEYQRERRDAHGAAWLIERPGAGERDDARLALRCRIELRHQHSQLSPRRLR